MLPEQQQRIMGYFIEEAKDHLNTIEQGLLNLQGTIEDTEMMNEVFRAAHSVKGGAAMLGIGAIQKVAHRLEDYFKVLRDTPVAIDQKLESLFLEVFDALQALLEQLQGPFGLQEEVSNGIMAGVEPVFANLHAHLEKLAGVSVKSDEIVVLTPVVTPPPTVVKPPARSDRDLVAAFQNQIPPRLREMLQLFKQPQTAETTQKLQELCASMGQLGEQYGVSPWCELVETSRLVIANPDNTYRTLAPILIKEIKQAQDLVIAGRVAEIITTEKIKELLPVAPVAEVTIDEEYVSDLLDIADESIGDFDSSESLEPQVTSPQDNLFDSEETEFSVTSIPEVPVTDTFDPLSSAASIAVEPPSYRLDSESTPMSVVEHPGPELEMAELNSLADLFEGEALELGATWQEVEIIGDDSGDSLSVLNDFETSRDFSDLLSDTESTDGLAPSSVVGDDLASLFGESDDLLNEDLPWSEPVSTRPSDASPMLDDMTADNGQPDLDADADLLAIDQPSVTNSTSNALDNLFAETNDLDNLFGDSNSADLFGDLPAETDLSPTESLVSDPPAIDSDLAANLPSPFDLENLFGEETSPADTLTTPSGLDLDSDAFFANDEAPAIDEAILELPDLDGNGDLLFADDPDRPTEPATPQPLLEMQPSTSTPVAVQPHQDLEIANDPWTNVFDDSTADESGTPAVNSWLDDDNADHALFFEDAPVASDDGGLDFLTGLEPDGDLDFLTASNDLGDLEFSFPEEDSLTPDGASPPPAETGIPETASPWEETLVENDRFATTFDFLSESDASSDLPLEESYVAEHEAIDSLTAMVATSNELTLDPSSLDIQSEATEITDALLDLSFVPSVDGSFPADVSTAFLPNLSDSDSLDFDSFGSLDGLEAAENDLTPDSSLAHEMDLDSLSWDAATLFGTEESMVASFSETPPQLDLADLDTADLFSSDSLFTEDVDAEDLHQSVSEATSDLTDLDTLLNEEAVDTFPTGLSMPELDAAIDFNEVDFLSEPSSGASVDTIEAAAEDFDKLGTLLEDVPDLTTLPVNDSSDDDFGDLDALLTQAPMSLTSVDSEDDFGDLDALLGEEASLASTESFTESDDDFGDLDALLSEEDNLTSTESFTESDDDFGDLDALLNEGDTNLTTAESTDFADLEAMLAEGGTEADATQPMASTTKPNADDDFTALENLLEPETKPSGGGQSILKSRPSTQTGRRKASSFADQTMRVPVKQLDNLSNLVGELVVNRNSLEQDQERLRQSLDNLLYQVQQLSDVGQRMRDLYERSLLESSLLATRQSHHGLMSGSAANTQSSHSTGVQFESIEMDRFTPFHTLSQEMIELIVRVRESSSDIEFIVDETDQVTRMFRQVTTQLQESVNRSRMVPFGEIERVFPLARAVRDGAVESGKQAELKIEGKDTLIDKLILERLSDPLKHLVNNAISHGVESPDIRRSLHKGPVGQITIQAFHQGNQTVISFSDDGAGIDIERVKFKAVEKGLISKAESQTMSRLDVYELLYHPGFSTKDEADMRSGRGVGMDVVRKSLDEIRGVITTDSITNKGTTFTIRLPLTLSISKALRCISNRAQIAFPMDGVEDMLDLPKERVQINSEGQNCIMWRDNLLPFQPLADVLKYNRQLGRGSIYGGSQEDDVISIIVLRSAGNFIALQVDQVMGEQEIVIKQLEGPVPKPLGVAGATVMGDGRIMPIADVLELIDLVQGRIRQEQRIPILDYEGDRTSPDAIAPKTDPTVLIVDDSITVRELLSMTFNKVGYRVEQARDGQDAWEKLRSGLPCDIVFCDIEMPRMDGLELLSRIQKDPTLSHLPIAMLTSRGADKHRQTAVQLGAKGYFTKPYLEEALLDAAQRMLKGEILVTNTAQASV